MWEWLFTSWNWISASLVLCIDLIATAHVILFKRDVRAAIGWVGLIWFVPGIGAVLYYLLGINRIARKARRLKRKRKPRHTIDREFKLISDEILLSEASHSQLAPLMRVVHELSGTPLVGGNAVRTLHSGTEAYHEMIQAIDEATDTVGLCTYIFDRDAVGMRFVEALGRAVSRGVDVRVLIDGVGARYSWPRTVVGPLRRVGVKVALFLPQFWPWHFAYANLRIHRKILVVDGTLGFTGGMNIRSGHDASTNPRQPIADLQVRLDGPVVDHLRRTFADDWEFCTRESLSGDGWFPPLASQGSIPARGFSGGPSDEFERVRAVCLSGLAIARHSVRIVTPYFLPDVALIAAINIAALRGVIVDILLPSENNLRLVQWACLGQINQVLGHG